MMVVGASLGRSGETGLIPEGRGMWGELVSGMMMPFKIIWKAVSGIYNGYMALVGYLPLGIQGLIHSTVFVTLGSTLGALLLSLHHSQS